MKSFKEDRLLQSQLKNTDYYWNDYKDDSPLHSLLAHSSFKWKKLTSFIGTFNIQLEKTVQYPNDFKDDRNIHHLWGHSNSSWKRQFSIDMISKITELYIICGTFKSQLKITVYYWNGKKDDKNYHSLWGDSKSQLKRKVYYWNDYKHERTLHYLFGHSNSNWQNLTSFVGTFKLQLKKTVQYLNDFKYEGTSHLLLGHSNSTGKNSSVPKWFQKWQKLTSFLGTLKFQLKKTVQYWNDFKDHRTLHPLWDIQIPTENNSLLLKW